MPETPSDHNKCILWVLAGVMLTVVMAMNIVILVQLNCLPLAKKTDLDPLAKKTDLD